MPKSKIILALGFIIALLPLLGFPHAWESFFQVFAGLAIVFLSVMISVDKRLSLRSKAEKRLSRRREEAEAASAEHPMAPSMRFGRRATDSSLNSAPSPEVENNNEGDVI
jgi:uncharacterized membrane protein YccC